MHADEPGVVLVDADLDPGRFATHTSTARGFALRYVREGVGGVPLLLVHGWPETKRLYWRVIEPLAAAGFEVIVPDLRGFGESDVGPDHLHDTVASSRDLHALVHDDLGHQRVVIGGGDFGGAIVQDLAARFPELVDRLVLFNSPLPYLADEMAGLTTRAESTHDYFFRQGTDGDALLAELEAPGARRRYVATFYSSRLWAHPGSFDDATIAFHADPFEDATKLRASWGAYESVFDRELRTERPMLGRNADVRTLLLYGPSDHVIAPDWDRMAALVYPDHVGPHLLRDVGHFVPWEAPGRFTQAVISFCGDLLVNR